MVPLNFVCFSYFKFTYTAYCQKLNPFNYFTGEVIYAIMKIIFFYTLNITTCVQINKNI